MKFDFKNTKLRCFLLITATSDPSQKWQDVRGRSVQTVTLYCEIPQLCSALPNKSSFVPSLQVSTPLLCFLNPVLYPTLPSQKASRVLVFGTAKALSVWRHLVATRQSPPAVVMFQIRPLPPHSPSVAAGIQSMLTGL